MQLHDKISNHMMPKGLVDTLDYAQELDHGPWNTYEGTIIANPGTEYVVLEVNGLKLITFVSDKYRGKQLYGIVETGQLPRNIASFVDTNHDRLTVVTREVFTIVATCMFDMDKQIKKLKEHTEQLKLERDLYKGTIDTLRNNGVIE